MSHATPVGLIATILVTLTSFAAWTFMLRYSRRSWRSTREGIHLMSLTFNIALFTGLATEVRIFGKYPFYDVAAAILYFFLAVVMIRQHVLLSQADAPPDGKTHPTMRRRLGLVKHGEGE